MTQVELNLARELSEQIRREEFKLQSLRDAISGLVPIIDGMPHAQSLTSRVERLTILIVDSEQSLNNLRAEFESACAMILEKLTKVDLSPREFEVLVQRYVRCKNYRDIEFAMSLSDARVFQIHREALQKIFSS